MIRLELDVLPIPKTYPSVPTGTRMWGPYYILSNAVLGLLYHNSGEPNAATNNFSTKAITLNPNPLP